MSKIQHHTVSGVVTVQLIDSLVDGLASTPLPRVREAARHQLYGIGVTVHEISQALERDLEAGDRILNLKPDEEQNAAPETQAWLEWLAMYELAQNQLRRIEDAIADSEKGAA